MTGHHQQDKELNTIVSPVKIRFFYLLCRDSSIILFHEQSGSYIFNYNKEHGRGFVEAWDRFEIHTNDWTPSTGQGVNPSSSI
jgi:hypothetical protein